MKTLNMRLVTAEGDILDSIPVEEFVIAEEWDDVPIADNQESINARVNALFQSVLSLLRQRQAAPEAGPTFLKLALGEALLTASDIPGDVMFEVTVRPLGEEENNGFDDSF